jgi:hypothetical protein
LHIQTLFLFAVILTVAASPTLFDNSFAQQNMSPHKQWKQFANLDMITCKPGNLLLQKSNGNPTCVMPSTYLELVDRGYGNHNQSVMDKRPQMMDNLMHTMVSNGKIMSHWHEMMQNDSYKMNQTMKNWISQMKENPELLKNMLGPMTSDPELREKMIQTMHNHNHMDNYLKSHSAWMDSVHQPMTSGMGHDNSGMGHNKNDSSNCSWCPNYSHHSMKSHYMTMSDSHKMTMSNSSKMMDMIHHMWIHPDVIQDMHSLMLEDPSHVAMMSNQMMEPMLNSIMDDEDLREQMIDLMLEHPDFMNSIRHENPEADH